MTDKASLILDANVVISYNDAGILWVLSLVNKHIGQVYIVTAVLEEVRDLSDVDCARRGFKVIKPTPLEMSHADKLQVPRDLSGVDRKCLAVAQERNYTCVTNEKRLRKSCEKRAVKCRGGLGLLTLLCEKHQITTNQAKEYAVKLKKTSGRISEPVMQEFFEGLGQLETRSRNTPELPTSPG